jgi:UDP-2-acetamido-3-amino-2,3-dideoxy-glucuronate N-acetyltransferase
MTLAVSSSNTMKHVKPFESTQRGAMPKVALVGCGYWGRNLARNFYQLGALAAVCDPFPAAKAWVEETFPNPVPVETSLEVLLEHSHIDALVIATPSETHHEMVARAIQAGKHVYVEKPFTVSGVMGRDLITQARERGLILMVGHLLMYHPAVFRLREFIALGHLGRVTMIESTRLNWNAKRADANVLWDLAPHDLSLISYIANAKAGKVISAMGLNSQGHPDGKIDMADMWVTLEKNTTFDPQHPLQTQDATPILSRVQVSWAYPVKQVRLLVRGTKGSMLLDDTQTQDKKLMWFPAETPQQGQPLDVLGVEPLKVECQHFLNAIQAGTLPKSDGENGVYIVDIIESALTMMGA